jgi:photosystem II stability/assembly factor-like uncharacterized protein
VCVRPAVRRLAVTGLSLALVLAPFAGPWQPTVAAAAPISTGDGSWVWQNPLPQGNDVKVSCPTPSICYLATAHAVLVTNDAGSTWTVRVPPISPLNNIAALACPAASLCYGLAQSYTGSPQIFITSDGGSTWIVQRAPYNFEIVSTILSCPTTTTCYALATTSAYPSLATMVVLRTADGGVTWSTRLLSLPTATGLRGIACPSITTCYAVGGQFGDDLHPYPINPQTTIVGTVDSGASWQIQLSTTGADLAAVSCPVVSTCVATGLLTGVLGTKDGGATWAIESATVAGRDIRCPTTGVCYVVNKSGPAGIYTTMDGGATWVPQSSPSFLSQGGEYFLEAISCLSISSCYASGYAGLVISTTTSGAVWTEVSSGSRASSSAISCPSDEACFAVGPSVTMRTTNGGSTWSVLSQGPGGNAIKCPSPATCYVLRGDTILKTADGGGTWTTQATFPAGGFPLTIDCPAVDVCYTGGTYDQILGTKDGGATWVTENSGMVSNVLSRMTCPSITTCYVVGAHVLRTTDGGTSWQPRGAVPNTGFSDLTCPTLTTCYLIAGAIWVSYDSAATWTAFTTTPQRPGWGYVTLSCPNPSTCFAQRVDGLLTMTTDGGATWSTQDVGISSPSVRLPFIGLACSHYDHCWGVGGGGILALAIPPALPRDSARPWTGGSTAVGVASAATDAYFAEGYTGPNFEEYITVENPGAAQTLTADYLLGDGTVITRTYDLVAQSRRTILVNAEVGFNQSVSAHLHAPNPFVAERPMYFDYQGVITGGHVAVGAASPGLTFYFAEGYTGPGFSEYLTLMNPGSTPASVAVTYYFNGGAPARIVAHQVPAHSRATVFVDDPAEAGSGQEVSVKVTSNQPIVAERPMYFDYFGETGGSDVVGAPALLTDMNLAEGHVGQSFDEYLTLFNPNSSGATATITYYLGSGGSVLQTILLSPSSRTTIHVNDVLPAGTDSSVHIHSDLPILAERPMYFTYLGRSGGHDALAVPDSALSTTQVFAEGFVSPGFAEYYTILNRNPQPAQVRITYLDEAGHATTKDIVIAASSRWTEFVNSDLPAYSSNSAIITSNLPILAERPMYFSY